MRLTLFTTFYIFNKILFIVDVFNRISKYMYVVKHIPSYKKVFHRAGLNIILCCTDDAKIFGSWQLLSLQYL